MRRWVLKELYGSNNLLDKKPRLKILILGPYGPESALRRLVDVKEYLISRGYESTKLAKDFNPEKMTDQEVFEMSRELMKNWADALFFFFFAESVREGRLIGVYDEFVTLCESIPEKISKSVVFIDKDIYKKLSMMFRGRITCFKGEFDLKVAFLESQEDTRKKAEMHAFNLLVSLGDTL